MNEGDELIISLTDVDDVGKMGRCAKTFLGLEVKAEKARESSNNI